MGNEFKRLICLFTLNLLVLGQHPVFAADEVSVSQELHPSGPTVRTQWRKSPMQPVYQIQYQGIKAGHPLVGRARLVRDVNGTWLIDIPGQAHVRLLGQTESNTTKPIRFVESQQTWSIQVTSQTLPVDEPGIATEAEPELDLVLVRR